MRSIYIHWPFCEKKCPYCDFNSHVRDSIDFSAWLSAFKSELDYYSGNFNDNSKNNKIKTIFFGGGTPSLMPVELISQILEYIELKFGLSDNVEITLEANPGSSEAEKFRGFKKAGINRISIGIQSLDDQRLKFLGRKHNAKQALNAMNYAAEIFERFSFDFIYSTPDQKIESWFNELEQALKFNPKHLSLYQLTIEKGTQFYHDYLNNKIIMPEDNDSENFYLQTVKFLKQNMLNQYEISNFAIEGEECQHNMTYWRYDDYLGIGPGAHSRMSISGNKYAIFNHHSPEKYIEQIKRKSHAQQSKIKLSRDEVIKEILYTALRTKEGISEHKFFQKTGLKIQEAFDSKLIEDLQNEKILQQNSGLVATSKGIMLHSSLYDVLKNSYLNSSNLNLKKSIA